MEDFKAIKEGKLANRELKFYFHWQVISLLETISLKEKYRKNCCDWTDTFNPENAEKGSWHLSELCNQSLSGTDKIFRSTSIPNFLANPHSMGRATEVFQATGGDVHAQCLSALTCRCFEEFAVTDTQAMSDESKSPTAVRILQQELCSLILLAPFPPPGMQSWLFPKTGNTGVWSS